MLEVEGGEHEWCMRILRHEAGHVIDNAYKLRLRRQRAQVFGSSSRAVSRVLHAAARTARASCMHLDPWYAQSHPDEDFAETFAVWLTPEAQWQQRYAGWPALKKLEYMDELMQSLRRQDAAARRRRRGRSAARACNARCASTTAASAGTTASTTRSSTIATCGGCSRTRPSTPDNMTAAQFLGRIRRPVRAGRRLDRHLPVHDRQGARGHDRALPRAEAAARRARGAGAAGVHRAPDGAGR